MDKGNFIGWFTTKLNKTDTEIKLKISADGTYEPIKPGDELNLIVDDKDNYETILVKDVGTIEIGDYDAKQLIINVERAYNGLNYNCSYASIYKNIIIE